MLFLLFCDIQKNQPETRDTSEPSLVSLFIQVNVNKRLIFLQSEIKLIFFEKDIIFIHEGSSEDAFLTYGYRKQKEKIR